jgi:hypothetical protein
VHYAASAVILQLPLISRCRIKGCVEWFCHALETYIRIQFCALA